jgi:hypothetical protein
LKRSVLAIVSVAAVLIVAVLALAGPFNPVTRAASTLQFEAKFETSGDFFDRFDFGYSGPNPWDWGNGTGAGQQMVFHGDHDMSCAGPTTSRDVTFGGDRQQLDFSQLFWYCAPGGDGTKGHVMTGVNTVSYNVAWFSPKPTFTNITQVCWDINETEMSHRKWTQVLFVGDADAHRYPTGSPTAISTARGTGGFDLGYTDPDNRDPNGPSSGLFPQGGTLAGFQDSFGSPSWFQNDAWSTQFAAGQILGITDKAARYKHCLTNQPNNVLRFTQDTPNGTRTIDLAGQIPSDARRVVFEDDNYNPPKDERYDPNVLTWHWDNIQIEASEATVVEAVTAPKSAAAGDSTAQAASPAQAAPPAAVAAPTGQGSGESQRGVTTAGIQGLVAVVVVLLALLGSAQVVARTRKRLTRSSTSS